MPKICNLSKGYNIYRLYKSKQVGKLENRTHKVVTPIVTPVTDRVTSPAMVVMLVAVGVTTLSGPLMAVKLCMAVPISSITPVTLEGGSIEAIVAYGHAHEHLFSSFSSWFKPVKKLCPSSFSLLDQDR